MATAIQDHRTSILALLASEIAQLEDLLAEARTEFEEPPKRYVTICMERQGDNYPGWPEDSAEFDTMALAEAAATGIGLVPNECVYARIWDRLKGEFNDCHAADAEDSPEYFPQEAEEVAQTLRQFGRITTADLPAPQTPAIHEDSPLC